MSPRKYDLGRRRGATAATRASIVEATRGLIGGEGDLTGFSMEAVAERAGVSRMTVYYQFRSRAGLLEAVSDDLAVRGGMSGLAGAFQETDPSKAVRAFVETFVRFWASDPVTLRRLRAMGVVFPSEHPGPRGRDAWRRAGWENLLARVRPPEAVPRADLVDLLGALTSFETYDALAGAGRSTEAVTELLAQTALRLLGLTATRRAPPGRSGPRRAHSGPGRTPPSKGA